LYGFQESRVSLAIDVLKTPWSRCVSCSSDTYSGDTGLLWCTDCAAGSYSPEGATECVVATTTALEQTTTPVPTSLVPADCQDDPDYDSYGITCAWLQPQIFGYGTCLMYHTPSVQPVCFKCCSLCYESCCLQKGVCKCAEGQYLEADDWSTFENLRCETCPPNSNSVAGAETINMCTCNAGFEGPPGGPCNLIKYPTAGCAAGYWQAPNSCKQDSHLVYFSFTCATYYQNYLPSSRYASCRFNNGCELCCNACAPNSQCIGRTPQPCTACPPNSHSPPGSTSQNACTCNAGYSGPAGGPCGSTGRRLLELPEAPAGAVESAYVCVDCPANSHSPFGSMAASACTCNAGYGGPVKTSRQMTLPESFQ